MLSISCLCNEAEILLRGCIHVSGAPGGAGSDASRLRRRYSGQRRGATPSAGGCASRQVPGLRLPTASRTGAAACSSAVHYHRLGQETEFRCIRNWYPSRSHGNPLCIVKVILYFSFIFQARMERRLYFGVIFARCIRYYHASVIWRHCFYPTTRISRYSVVHFIRHQVAQRSSLFQFAVTWCLGVWVECTAVNTLRTGDADLRF